MGLYPFCPAVFDLCLYLVYSVFRSHLFCPFATPVSMSSSSEKDGSVILPIPTQLDPTSLKSPYLNAISPLTNAWNRYSEWRKSFGLPNPGSSEQMQKEVKGLFTGFILSLCSGDWPQSTQQHWQRTTFSRVVGQTLPKACQWTLRSKWPILLLLDPRPLHHPIILLQSSPTKMCAMNNASVIGC